MVVDLKPEQQRAVDELHNGAILLGGTGSGKSITSIAYYVSKVCKGTYDDPGSMRTPRDLYIITTAKKRDSADWEREALRFNIPMSRENSQAGIRVVVDSWNNIKNYTEVENAFFIFDEQRVVGYGAWSRAFIRIARDNNNQWILLSATPGDVWLDYMPVFIANGWYRNKTHFLEEHVVWTPRVKYPKVLRYQQVGVLVRRRDQVLVHMPLTRHTKRHIHKVVCDYDTKLFDKVVKNKWHVYEKRPLRDISEQFSVMRKVVNSDDSRAQALLELTKKHPRLIVFYNFNYELEMLRELGKELNEEMNDLKSTSREKPSSSSSKTPSDSISRLRKNTGSSNISSFAIEEEQTKPTKVSTALARNSKDFQKNPEVSGSTTPKETASFAVAEWNGQKHEEIPETDRWLYLVQYTAGAEGWNCVTTDAMALWSQTYSYRAYWQALGRIDRMNTPYTDLHYYNFTSGSLIDKAIGKALSTKKNFNERSLKLPG